MTLLHLSADDDIREVGVIVGGEGRNQVEVFSEAASSCKATTLSSIPTGQVRNPVLVLFSGSVVSCDSDTCWRLDPDDKRWKHLTQVPAIHRDVSFSSGCVFRGHLFLLHGEDFIAFEPETGKWRTLPGPKKKIGDGNCLLASGNFIYVFGGRDNAKGVERYEVEEQSWSSLETSGAPLDLVYSGCGLINENQVLVVGSENFFYRKKSAIFDFGIGDWRSVGSTSSDRFGSSLLKLNDRIFVTGGGFGSNPSRIVEEFHPENGTWTVTGFELRHPRTQHSSVVAPVSMLCY